jgi:hypothetical protein
MQDIEFIKNDVYLSIYAIHTYLQMLGHVNCIYLKQVDIVINVLLKNKLLSSLKKNLNFFTQAFHEYKKILNAS